MSKSSESWPDYNVGHITATLIDWDPDLDGRMFLITIRKKTIDKDNKNVNPKNVARAEIRFLLASELSRVLNKDVPDHVEDINPVRQRAALTQPHFLEGPDAPYYFPVWKVIFKDDAAAKEACSALPVFINTKTFTAVCHPILKKYRTYVKKDAFEIPDIWQPGIYPPYVGYQLAVAGEPFRILSCMSPTHSKSGGMNPDFDRSDPTSRYTLEPLVPFGVLAEWKLADFSRYLDSKHEGRSYEEDMNEYFEGYAFKRAKDQDKIADKLAAAGLIQRTLDTIVSSSRP